ncbi:ABC transporter ATP-binding protein [Microbulbifer sp. SAOS-129_SWC]|uniref:ABC transporter ATP-binding protein n=1 Tax=Microbulbifer sp. SAOS-129_SWC TaxID=3145235 RepID=UPI003217BF2E
MNLVEFESVSKHYRLGEVEVSALDQVDFTVCEGDFVALTGPSGSGKTTMLNLIGCLDYASSGEIRVLGQPVSQLEDKALDQLRSRTYGIIFQNFNLVPVLTALENVALPLHLHRLPAVEMDRRARAALEAVGLTRFADFRPDQLSGGQRQRVAVARALVTEPKLILADEPTASLDSASALSLVELMKKLNREQRATFVFSTHDQRLLAHVDRVVELRDGRLTAAAETAQSAGAKRAAPATGDSEVA